MTDRKKSKLNQTFSDLNLLKFVVGEWCFLGDQLFFDHLEQIDQESVVFVLGFLFLFFGLFLFLFFLLAFFLYKFTDISKFKEMLNLNYYQKTARENPYLVPRSS